MSDARSAAQLAEEAYELWQQERLEEAAPKYREAVRCASRDDPALADYHGELAAVLDGLGLRDEAEQALECSLAVELERALDTNEVGVVIARYFLAEFLLRHDEAQRALDTVLPHLPACRSGVWLLHLIETEALAALGNRDGAEHAARRTLATAPSEDKRSELRLRFLAIGLHDATF